MLWNYFVNILIAIDQLIYTFFGGYPDETFSAACYRKKDKKTIWFVCYKVVNFLFFWEDDHCKESYDSEMERSQLPKHYD